MRSERSEDGRWLLRGGLEDAVRCEGVSGEV